MKVRALCTFRVAGMELALPAGDVEEATRHLAVTPVPLAATGVKGLAHVRGRIIPVISLRSLFGLSGEADAEHVVHLITRSGDGAVSLEVDRILDVLETEEHALLPVPESLDAALRRYLAAAITLPDRLLLLLDLRRVLGGGEPDPQGLVAGAVAG